MPTTAQVHNILQLFCTTKRPSGGIETAKARGAYKGRLRTVDRARVRELRAAGHGATAIARELGIGCATVYKLFKADA